MNLGDTWFSPSHQPRKESPNHLTIQNFPLNGSLFFVTWESYRYLNIFLLFHRCTVILLSLNEVVNRNLLFYTSLPCCNCLHSSHLSLIFLIYTEMITLIYTLLEDLRCHSFLFFLKTYLYKKEPYVWHHFLG